MWRKLLDGALIVLILFQVWQWWPGAYEEFAEPDDTIALLEAVEAVRPAAPLSYLESMPTLPLSNLLLASSTTTLALPEIYQSALPSTVVIVGYDEWDERILGTGVILTETGLIATNEHVIADMAELYVVLSDKTTVLPVETIVYSDSDQDLALVQISEDDLTPATLSVDSPRIGDPVTVLGHPELFLYSLSTGIVSGQRTYTAQGGRFIQLTAAVNYGNSGGPVFNQAGHLVGLVSWSLEYEQNVQNVEGLHFAIPATAIVELFSE